LTLEVFFKVSEIHIFKLEENTFLDQNGGKNVFLDPKLVPKNVVVVVVLKKA